MFLSPEVVLVLALFSARSAVFGLTKLSSFALWYDEVTLVGCLLLDGLGSVSCCFGVVESA